MTTKKVFFVFLLIGFSLTSIAQNKTSKAFSESYQSEYNKNYKVAIAKIMAIYDANSYEINLRLGWLHYIKGNQVKSQSYYKTAIKLKPSSVEPKLGYTYPTGVLQQWNDLIKTYNEILKLDPNNYAVNINIATIYFNKKDFATAKKHASILNKLYPFDFDVNLLLAKINIGLGNINEAKINLEMALLYNPSSTIVLNLLGKI